MSQWAHLIIAVRPGSRRRHSSRLTNSWGLKRHGPFAGRPNGREPHRRRGVGRHGRRDPTLYRSRPRHAGRDGGLRLLCGECDTLLRLSLVCVSCNLSRGQLHSALRWSTYDPQLHRPWPCPAAADAAAAVLGCMAALNLVFVRCGKGKGGSIGDACHLQTARCICRLPESSQNG